MCRKSALGARHMVRYRVTKGSHLPEARPETLPVALDLALAQRIYSPRWVELFRRRLSRPNRRECAVAGAGLVAFLIFVLCKLNTVGLQRLKPRLSPFHLPIRILLASATAGVGAVSHLVPDLAPLLAPGERALADDTGLGGQIGLCDPPLASKRPSRMATNAACAWPTQRRLLVGPILSQLAYT